MPLDATIKLTLDASHRKPMDLATPQDLLSLLRITSLGSGTGAGQIDRAFHDGRSLAAEGSEELNLATLSDAFGDPLGLARLKVLYLRNLSAEDALLIGGAAANAAPLFADASDVLTLPPGGIFLLTAPDADGIALGGGVKLKLAHGGPSTSALDYEIVILGTSA